MKDLKPHYAIPAAIVAVIFLAALLEEDRPIQRREWLESVGEAQVAVRAVSGVDHPVVGQLVRGDEVRVLEQNRGWKRIQTTGVDPLEGWIPATASRHAGYGETRLRTEMVDAPKINVRAGPGTDHPVIGQLTELALVEIYEERSGWKRIKAPGQIEDGWVLGRLTAATPSKVRVMLREKFATVLERTYLDSFQEATVRAVGAKKTTLVIDWPIVTKVGAHHFQKNFPFAEARELGFKRIRLSDHTGHYSWHL